MCRRSLVEYLTNHLVVGAYSHTPLQKEWIYRLLFDEDKKEVGGYFTRHKLWYRLEEVLDNLAVIDPACGSGAFLVGMLHVLVELYRLIYSHIQREMTEFELKKRIIGVALYGVDVMPWAVHSAELRLWLQLIIDADIPPEQRKLHPLLPNLDLKLRVGDSLVQKVEGLSLRVKDMEISPSLKRKLLSLKTEKEKYYNNDSTAKFKDPKSLLQEELRIFTEILDDRIITFQKEIQSAEVKRRLHQRELFKEHKDAKPEQKGPFEVQIKVLEQKIEEIREVKRKIKEPGHKPFVRDIDFAEIFGDKGGFDIVIGNPPYVRQEKIAPPNKLKAEVTLEDKREYKERLFESVHTHFPCIQKIDKKSDYYIYFYFNGLALLNDKGTFCFITSNSWLDVGYGKDLQEFLLKYCHIKAIYDNQSKRSFEHADVNTIIALFGPPQVGAYCNTPLQNTAKFVMFKRPFEEAINTRNLLEIEKARDIVKTDAYRIFPVKQETLLEEGWEYPEDNDVGANGRSPSQKPKQKTLIKDKFLTGKYEGNKWGGKYLRAPDIFYTILENGKDKLEAIEPHIGKVITVAWSRKGLNSEILISKSEDAAKYETLPVLKSPREIEKIVFRKSDTTTLLLLIKGIKRELKHAKLLWVDIRGDRHLCHFNTHDIYFTHNFHGIIPNDDSLSTVLCGLLNSTLTAFFVEVLGRKGLGGGAVRLLVEDLRRDCDCAITVTKGAEKQDKRTY